MAGSGFWVVVFFLSLAASALLLERTAPVRAPLDPRILLPPPATPEQVTLRLDPVRSSPPNFPGIIVPGREDPVVPKEIFEAPPPPLKPREGNATGEGSEPIVVPSAIGDDVRPDPYAPPDVDEFPEPITKVLPIYPEIAREAGVAGTVVVRVLVGKDGRVRDAFVEPKSSLLLLDGEALEAARRWVFKPAMTHNHPVSVWVTIPMRFTLH